MNANKILYKHLVSFISFSPPILFLPFHFSPLNNKAKPAIIVNEPKAKENRFRLFSELVLVGNPTSLVVPNKNDRSGKKR